MEAGNRGGSWKPCALGSAVPAEQVANMSEPPARTATRRKKVSREDTASKDSERGRRSYCGAATRVSRGRLAAEPGDA